MRESSGAQWPAITPDRRPRRQPWCHWSRRRPVPASPIALPWACGTPIRSGNASSIAPAGGTSPPSTSGCSPSACRSSMTTIDPSPRTRVPDRSCVQRPPSLERLLDCTGEREQTLLDENGHFADEIHRLAALLEDTRVPFDAIGQLVDSALVGIGAVLKLTQLENRGSDLVGKLLLFARIPLDPLHHFAALVIEGFEQSRKYQLRLLLPFGFGARDGVCDALLRVVERRAARRKPRDQIPYRGVFLPSVPDIVDGRTCPHGGNGDFRHFDLVAGPIGEARIRGERRAA